MRVTKHGFVVVMLALVSTVDSLQVGNAGRKFVRRGGTQRESELLGCAVSYVGKCSRSILEFNTAGGFSPSTPPPIVPAKHRTAFSSGYGTPLTKRDQRQPPINL